MADWQKCLDDIEGNTYIICRMPILQDHLTYLYFHFDQLRWTFLSIQLKCNTSYTTVGEDASSSSLNPNQSKIKVSANHTYSTVLCIYTHINTLGCLMILQFNYGQLHFWLTILLFTEYKLKAVKAFQEAKLYVCKSKLTSSKQDNFILETEEVITSIMGELPTTTINHYVDLEMLQLYISVLSESY